MVKEYMGIYHLDASIFIEYSVFSMSLEKYDVVLRKEKYPSRNPLKTGDLLL